MEIEFVWIADPASITYFLITTSRKYKELKKSEADLAKIRSKENILKLITLFVLVVTFSFSILVIL